MSTSELTTLLTDARTSIAAARTADDVDRLHTVWFGRKGRLTALLATLSKLPPPARRERGRQLNELKQEIVGLLHDRRREIGAAPAITVDPTLPGERPVRGHLHPLTHFSREVADIWRSLGYDFHEGPELEDQWYNFEGLNMPADHPARDIQDTFYIKHQPNLVLRTHSSTVQLRSLRHFRPPLKVVEIGRVYRHEATDAKHESMFTQCDGVVIDRQVTMAHLVTTLRVFLEQLFPGRPIRVRPSYFPFVEPGIEVDLQWAKDGRTEWLEILGAGLIHPNVLKAMKLSPQSWSGFAFGMGMDRLALLKYGIPDVRLFYNGNLDFLAQF